MPVYVSIPLPGPLHFSKRVGLSPFRGARRRARGPVWKQPWFWITGAFVLVLMWWVLVAEFYLVYGIVWCLVWAFRWLVTVALVGPEEARRTRREDKIHAARAAEQGENW